MARQPKPLAQTPKVNLDEEQMAEDMQKVNELALFNSQASENAQAVAAQLGYDGALTVGALEDEIRFYQRRTAEACLELGKRLLILKELSLHGEFMQRVELLGFSDRTCNRFMQAAFKFSKVANLANLSDKIGTQSKLLELVTMDDDEIVQLSNGESVRGLTLDDIDTMTASQLKAALRESRENYEAQGRVLAQKNSAFDKLSEQFHTRESRAKTLPPDEVAKELRTEANLFAFQAQHALYGKLDKAFHALSEHAADNGGDHLEYMSGLVNQVELELLKLREKYNLKTLDDGGAIPDWLQEAKADWDAKHPEGTED